VPVLVAFRRIRAWLDCIGQVTWSIIAGSRCPDLRSYVKGLRTSSFWPLLQARSQKPITQGESHEDTHRNRRFLAARIGHAGLCPGREQAPQPTRTGAVQVQRREDSQDRLFESAHERPQNI